MPANLFGIHNFLKNVFETYSETLRVKSGCMEEEEEEENYGWRPASFVGAVTTFQPGVPAVFKEPLCSFCFTHYVAFSLREKTCTWGANIIKLAREGNETSVKKCGNCILFVVLFELGQQVRVRVRVRVVKSRERA